MKSYVCEECRREWLYDESRLESIETHERQYGHHVYILNIASPERRERDT